MKANSSSEASTKSHLYPGYCIAEAVPSIFTQRSLQTQCLQSLSKEITPKGNFLTVGVAYGNELSFFIDSIDFFAWQNIDAIDIADDLEKHLDILSKIINRRGHFDYRQMDLRELDRHPRFGKWSLIQCGFVLQDIPYDEKLDVFKLLHDGLAKGGGLLLSEMFLSNEQADEASPDQHQILNIRSLYNQFIGEAQECLINGILTQDQYNSLCGTLETEGLISSKYQAVQGHRDYFLSLEKHNFLLAKAGFVDMRCYHNRLNRFLGVISALKRE